MEQLNVSPLCTVALESLSGLVKCLEGEFSFFFQRKLCPSDVKATLYLESKYRKYFEEERDPRDPVKAFPDGLKVQFDFMDLVSEAIYTFDLIYESYGKTKRVRKTCFGGGWFDVQKDKEDTIKVYKSKTSKTYGFEIINLLTEEDLGTGEELAEEDLGTGEELAEEDVETEEKDVETKEEVEEVETEEEVEVETKETEEEVETEDEVETKETEDEVETEEEVEVETKEVETKEVEVETKEVEVPCWYVGAGHRDFGCFRCGNPGHWARDCDV